MNHKDVYKRIEAAQGILQSPEVSRASFERVRELLSGINASLDKKLASISKAWKKLNQLHKGEIVDLTAESLPEKTKEQKKRKKALLLLIGKWKSLKSEVRRIEKELAPKGASMTNPKTLVHILSAAKGPLGIITIVAAAIVTLKAVEVGITVRNDGCAPLQAPSDMSINIPGLVLPDESVPDGGEIEVRMPPLSVRVDASRNRMATVTVAGMEAAYTVPSGMHIYFDEHEVTGSASDLALRSSKHHVLRIVCR